MDFFLGSNVHLWHICTAKGPSVPFGNCLPGTELPQSSFKTGFIMGSLSRRYRQSLWRHRWFLWSYRRSLRRSAVVDVAIPIIARLTKHRKTLLNIVIHHETLVKHCDSSWNVVKHREPLLKHCETSRNTRHSMQRYRRSMRRHRRSARRHRCFRRVSADIGAEFLAISAIAELV